MMLLAARFADGWNGWIPSGPTVNAFIPMIEKLEKACGAVGRDPKTLRRTLDIQIDSLGVYKEIRPDGTMKPISGSKAGIAESILSFADIDVDEVRCYLVSKDSTENKSEAILSMEEIIKMVHRG